MEDTTDFLKCPCCSEKLFKDCCKPVIEDRSKSVTAEQLMRSRYTAFTLEDNQYLMDSWARATRPESVQTEDTGIQWVSLEVFSCEKGRTEDSDGAVSFSARFMSSGHLCSLHEKSRFIKEDELWYYLDGKTRSDTVKIGRNAPCPCGSGKKYKRCCC